jgi:hypothetical protein
LGNLYLSTAMAALTPNTEPLPPPPTNLGPQLNVGHLQQLLHDFTITDSEEVAAKIKNTPNLLAIQQQQQQQQFQKQTQRLLKQSQRLREQTLRLLKQTQQLRKLIQQPRKQNQQLAEITDQLNDIRLE